jgi:Family of unknown function (DUF5719)
LGEVRRWPVLVGLAAVVVAGVLLSQLGTGTPSPVATAPAASASDAPVTALSGSWFCAGATAAPDSVASGELVFANAGTTAVQGTVRLVSPIGYFRRMSVTVPAGSTSTVVEEFLGLPRHAPRPWVGALVTLYGGMASVSQVISTPEGAASQPCASAASTHWYFVDGATLRNASDHISLLNPYPVDAIADLSFTTNEGQEDPSAFEGVLVPANGITVVNLGSNLRLREHIAVTVTARTGQLVAFETELVTRPPAGAYFEGPHQGLNPAAPVDGVTLALGATRPSPSWWWPAGSDGNGLSETYIAYDPGPVPARLSLVLLSQGTESGLGTSSELTVAPYGTASVRTNGQPWALPGIMYAVHLVSTNGVPVVAERSVSASRPSPIAGLGALIGQAQPADDWLLPGTSAMAPTKHRGQVWLEVANPGQKAAVLNIEALTGSHLAQAVGIPPLGVRAGGRTGLELPAGTADEALVVKSSQPVVVEDDSWANRPQVGINLAPVVALGS